MIFAILFSITQLLALDETKLLWGKSPNESLVQPMVNTFVLNEVVEFKPIEGHHFNLKANNNCQVVKPKLLTEKNVQCQFPEPGKFNAMLFICDDANTFCKMEKISLDVNAPRGYKSATKKRVSSNILYVPKAEIKTPPGFIKNRDTFAKEQAVKKDQPLLIVFAAQWCPFCNMMDENVFQTKAFQDETKNLTKLIVDVDSDISWDLKERFKVGGYPTTILTTSTLNEIGRFVGYRSQKGLSKWLTETLKLKDEPIEMVQSKIVQLKDSSKDSVFEKEYNQKLLRLAKWHYDQNEFDRALGYLEDLKGDEVEKLKLKSRLNISKKTEDKKRTISLLKDLISDYPEEIDFAYWMSDLSLLDVEQASKYTEKMETNLQKWVGSKELELAEYLPSELYYAAAETYENIGQKSFAIKHYSNCANEYEKLEKQSALKKPRGAPLERAFCLVKAGQNSDALNLFEKLANQYRQEFGYNYYYARALLDSGEKDKAMLYVRRSLEGAYGDNLIRAATLKAQIEIKMEDLKAAEKTLESTLSKIYLPSTTQIRTHRYVANLKNVLTQVQLKKLEDKK